VQVADRGLRVVSGSAAPRASLLDADAFQLACVDGFVASWSARGFSAVTIENGGGVLERFLEMLDVPAWQAGPDDVDRVVAELVAKGMVASTRRGYVQAFKAFHRFLVVRKAAEIEATFGVHLDDPVDEFNASRHVGNDSASEKAPPTPERMQDSSRSSGTGSPRPASSVRPDGTTRCIAPCITPGYARTRRRHLSCRTCILAGVRSARSTFASGRGRGARGHDLAGCRCSISST
jgi:Phage integrase, N-terminal SAM-like domain